MSALRRHSEFEEHQRHIAARFAELTRLVAACDAYLNTGRQLSIARSRERAAVVAMVMLAGVLAIDVVAASFLPLSPTARVRALAWASGLAGMWAGAAASAFQFRRAARRLAKRQDAAHEAYQAMLADQGQNGGQGM